MEIIVGSKYKELRDLYQLFFVKEDWKSDIGNGYFWENLKQYHMKSEYYCLEYIKNQKSVLYVMWDPLENVEIQDQEYWKYPAKSILRLSVNEFIQLFTTLPEDIYVFDDSFEWSIIFTHEDIFDKKRYCLELHC